MADYLKQKNYTCTMHEYINVQKMQKDNGISGAHKEWVQAMMQLKATLKGATSDLSKQIAACYSNNVNYII